MAVFIETQALRDFSNHMERINNDATQSLYELDNMINRLKCDWDGVAGQKMGDSFWNIRNKYYDERENELRRYTDFLNQVVATSYENAESKNVKAADDVKGNTALKQSLGTAVKVGATIISGVASSTTSSTAPVNSRNENVYSSSGAPKYKLPDYVYQGLYPDANGVWGEYVFLSNGKTGRICTWNRPGELSCTYYTLRKLNERGLSFPCVSGPGNGRDWYYNFDTASGAPSFGGANALNDLANNLSLPQENIVVSFESNTSIDLKHCGHVMLIDKMYKDSNGNTIVEWSDNWPSISNVNGYNPTKTATLEQFKNQYRQYNGNPVGVVVVGAGN